MKGLDELHKSIGYAIRYGLHSNDLSLYEVQSGICAAIDNFLKANDTPTRDWDQYIED